jgi:NAD(P)-dependent dehydrogenase (short-subunit alcohol dehydrogenase family)
MDTALITGAGAGFGLLTSVALARHGFRVVASVRDLARTERLDQAAAAAGVTLEKVQLDVTRPDSIARAMAEVGAVDVLVNNAGFGMGGALEDLTLDELREQFETNFFGLVAMTKAVLPGMRERRKGKIINVSSINGRMGTPGMTAYTSSKFAVEGLSESLRLEVSRFGIYVSLVEPGTFKTDIFTRNKRVAKRAHDPGSPYYAFTKHMEDVLGQLLERNTADPIAVANRIVKIALAKKPRLRYLVGKDARGEAFAKAVLPFSVLEWGVKRYIGEPQS